MSSQAPTSQARGELAALGLTASAVLLLDQVTKAMVVGAIGLDDRVKVLGDLVWIWHLRNEGAAFSLFQGGQLLFYAVTVLALGMLVYFQRAFRGRGLLLHGVLGLVLGGTLGNLVDRVRLGYVTDFISVGIGDLRWPTWNVADASMVVGIGCLVVYLTFFDRPLSEASA